MRIANDKLTARHRDGMKFAFAENRNSDDLVIYPGVAFNDLPTEEAYADRVYLNVETSYHPRGWGSNGPARQYHGDDWAAEAVRWMVQQVGLQEGGETL